MTQERNGWVRPPRGAAGVYAIRHRRTGAVYIGSSGDLRQRASLHRSALRRGRHWIASLQAAWAKEGEAAFEFAILEEVPIPVSPSSLNDAEQRWDRHFRELGLTAYSKTFHPRSDRLNATVDLGERLVITGVFVANNQRAALKLIAQRKQMTFGAVVREAIREYLTRDDATTLGSSGKPEKEPIASDGSRSPRIR